MWAVTYIVDRCIGADVAGFTGALVDAGSECVVVAIGRVEVGDVGLEGVNVALTEGTAADVGDALYAVSTAFLVL